MKNFLVSLLFSFSVTTLFLPSDMSATKNKKSDVTPEEQAALNAKLLLTARYNRFESSLKLVELGADLDAHNEQEKSPREMLEEALKQQEEMPMSPTSPHQSLTSGGPHIYCCAIAKALYKKEFEIRAQNTDIKNKLKALLDQQKRLKIEQASSVEQISPKLTIDTTVNSVTPKANQSISGLITPTSPSNPYSRVLCCASYRAVRNH